MEMKEYIPLFPLFRDHIETRALSIPMYSYMNIFFVYNLLQFIYISVSLIHIHNDTYVIDSLNAKIFTFSHEI